MNSALQRVRYLFSEFKKHISEEYPNGVQQNKFKLGQATEDHLKGCLQVAQEAREFVQFYEEVLKIIYINNKYQFENLSQAKKTTR